MTFTHGCGRQLAIDCAVRADFVDDAGDHCTRADIATVRSARSLRLDLHLREWRQWGFFLGPWRFVYSGSVGQHRWPITWYRWSPIHRAVGYL